MRPEWIKSSSTLVCTGVEPKGRVPRFLVAQRLCQSVQPLLTYAFMPNSQRKAGSQYVGTGVGTGIGHVHGGSMGGYCI
jgi:hypothetical protein